MVSIRRVSFDSVGDLQGSSIDVEKYASDDPMTRDESWERPQINEDAIEGTGTSHQDMILNLPVIPSLRHQRSVDEEARYYLRHAWSFIRVSMSCARKAYGSCREPASFAPGQLRPELSHPLEHVR